MLFYPLCDTSRFTIVSYWNLCFFYIYFIVQLISFMGEQINICMEQNGNGQIIFIVELSRLRVIFMYEQTKLW